jgi:hypothetical protein
VIVRGLGPSDRHGVQDGRKEQGRREEVVHRISPFAADLSAGAPGK